MNAWRLFHGTLVACATASALLACGQIAGLVSYRYLASADASSWSSVDGAQTDLAIDTGAPFDGTSATATADDASGDASSDTSVDDSGDASRDASGDASRDDSGSLAPFGAALVL